jgi:hypothetical protein
MDAVSPDALMQEEPNSETGSALRPQSAVVEFEFSNTLTVEQIARRAVELMYASSGVIGTLPRNVTNLRLVAVNGVYRPAAQDLELRRA